MNYLMFVVSDGVMTETKREAIGRLDDWAQEMDGRGVRRFGRPLQAPQTALTVRVRDGETLVSDGPFTESKEFVGGFDLLSCRDLDEAIEVAAAHPMCCNALELRPLGGGLELSERALTWAAQAPTDSWVAFFCADGVPETDEVERRIGAEARAWDERLGREGVFVFGAPLAPAQLATTIRVRDGQTHVSDGPFVETEEFIGAVAVLHGLSRDAIVAAVADHPLAAHHKVEVRRFLDL